MQTHKSLKHFERVIRRRNKIPDIVKIDNIIYTIDNYDIEGKEISFGNKRTFKGFNIETEDRYTYGMIDAIIEEFEPICFRNDISYYD